MKRLIILTLSLVAFIAMSGLAGDHSYVGVTKCKGCHKAQFTSWSETKHAKAFDALNDEQKKDEKCTVCHVTGMAGEEQLTGVQCEACHGPGSDYKSPKIMKKSAFKDDPAAALKAAQEAGLIIPDEKTCVRCHKAEGNPNFKEFNFEKSKGLVHPIKEETTEKAK